MINNNGFKFENIELIEKEEEKIFEKKKIKINELKCLLKLIPFRIILNEIIPFLEGSDIYDEEIIKIKIPFKTSFNYKDIQFKIMKQIYGVFKEDKTRKVFLIRKVFSFNIRQSKPLVFTGFNFMNFENGLKKEEEKVKVVKKGIYYFDISKILPKGLKLFLFRHTDVDVKIVEEQFIKIIKTQPIPKSIECYSCGDLYELDYLILDEIMKNHGKIKVLYSDEIPKESRKYIIEEFIYDRPGYIEDENEVLSIFDKMKGLKKIEIRNVDRFYAGSAFEKIKQNDNIIEAAFNGGFNLDDNHVFHLIKKCKNIERLYFHNTDVSIKGLQSFVKESNKNGNGKLKTIMYYGDRFSRDDNWKSLFE